MQLEQLELEPRRHIFFKPQQLHPAIAVVTATTNTRVRKRFTVHSSSEHCAIIARRGLWVESHETLHHGCAPGKHEALIPGIAWQEDDIRSESVVDRWPKAPEMPMVYLKPRPH